MYVGHFGVSLALKKYDQSLSLGLLFFAVQFVDFLTPISIFLGIENARIVPNFVEASYLDLYDMPITHSLLGAFIWAIATYFVFRYFVLRSSSDTDAEKLRASLLMGIAVFSHYILDFLVHIPDLLIIPGIDFKIGLGLWNYYLPSILIEAVFLLGGFLVYNQTTPTGSDVRSKYGMHVFIVVLLLVNFMLVTPHPLPGVDILGASLILAALSAFLSEFLPDISGQDALTKELTRRNILDASLVVIFSYAAGYLIPMFVGYAAIPGFDTFIHELVFLLALGIGLLTAGITSYLVAVYRSSTSG